MAVKLARAGIPRSLLLGTINNDLLFRRGWLRLCLSAVAALLTGAAEAAIKYLIQRKWISGPGTGVLDGAIG